MRVAPLLLAACAGPVSLDPATLPLASVSAWAPTDLQTDPLASHQPATVDCPEGAWGEEDGALEVQTGVCDYFAVQQPTEAELAAGDRLTGTVWYQDLDAAEPGQGHVAIWVGGDVVWDAWVDIPTPAAVLPVDVALDADWPEGTAIGLHLHNHGFNSWKFTDLGVDR